MPLTVSRLYFENAVGRVFEHADGYLVVQYRPGPRVLGDFQALVLHTRNVLHRNGWHRVLADQRHMSPFTAPETSWVDAFWRDPANQPPAGLHAAVVLADDVFARLATNLLRETMAGALTYQLFLDETSAVAWLQQVA